MAVDALQPGGASHLHRQSCVHRRTPDLPGVGRAQSPVPARLARRVNRPLKLKVRPATEVLPVRVLNPGGNRGLIAQIMQSSGLIAALQVFQDRLLYCYPKLPGLQGRRRWRR